MLKKLFLVIFLMNIIPFVYHNRYMMVHIAKAGDSFDDEDGEDDGGGDGAGGGGGDDACDNPGTTTQDDITGYYVSDDEVYATDVQSQVDNCTGEVESQATVSISESDLTSEYNEYVANLSDLADQSSTDNTDEGADSGTMTPITKYFNPQWQCLTNPLGWGLWSDEAGTVKLTDPTNNVWTWQTLTHTSIELHGTTFGATAITYSQGIGTPSFTPGTKNVLYAGMSLQFTVTYTLVCASCKDWPIIGSFIPSTTRSYPSTSTLWSANPTTW